jgi:hypothetical protein
LIIEFLPARVIGIELAQRDRVCPTGSSLPDGIELARREIEPVEITPVHLRGCARMLLLIDESVTHKEVT